MSQTEYAAALLIVMCVVGLVTAIRLLVEIVWQSRRPE